MAGSLGMLWRQREVNIWDHRWKDPALAIGSTQDANADQMDPCMSRVTTKTVTHLPGKSFLYGAPRTCQGPV